MIRSQPPAQGWAWFYALYSAVNAASAWLILSGRI